MAHRTGSGAKVLARYFSPRLLPTKSRVSESPGTTLSGTRCPTTPVTHHHCCQVPTKPPSPSLLYIASPYRLVARVWPPAAAAAGPATRIMSSSFEKSVKGATKIKVRPRRATSTPHAARELTTAPECAPQDKVHRAPPRRDAFGREEYHRGHPCAAVPPRGCHVDRRLQEPHHRPSHDSRGRARRHPRAASQKSQLSCH